MDSSTTNNELFICFASRLSSSSMKISSSKSILSPGRPRDPPNTLPTSLSRRLRSNGSIKGGQASPMFPTGAKKRPSTFDNPEPSSPKVTCIGQVRVKTKNKSRKLRTLSRKQSAETSFRKLEQHQGSHTHSHTQNQLLDFQNQPSTEGLPQQRTQKWVHFPVTISDAFSCLFPCKSSCFSTSEREDKAVLAMNTGEGGERQSSCPEVFARWLVDVQEGEGGEKERDIVNEGEMRNSRRHIFDELEISDEICQGKNEDLGKAEEGRISTSVPPKNALLLMRCRSDPNKMAALANRFWESPVFEDEDQDEEEKEKDEEEKEIKENDYINPEQVVLIHVEEEEEQSPEADSVLYVDIQNDNEQGTQEDSDLDMSEELLLLFQETDVHQKMDLEWENASEDHQNEVNGENVSVYDIEKEERSSYCSSSSSITSDEESQETEESALCSETESAIEEVTEDEKTTNKRADPENTVIYQEEEEDRESSFLPDCLLMMMMCEPKLSMEVSKETWVCSTDFIRRRSKKVIKQIDCGDGELETVSTDPGEALHSPIKTPPAAALAQPPRSSCSLPVSNNAMAAVIEQKLVNAVGYEPFLLTRCKSAPLRSVPDTCFWKKNLEPHRHSNFGVGAAGIGF